MTATPPTPEIVVGPPGCGKTTALLDVVEEELARGTPPDRIGFLSFTRQAAGVAVERARARFGLDKKAMPWARTLHSLAYRVLGLTPGDVLEGARLREFSDYAGVRVTGAWDADGARRGLDRGDRMMFLENLARVRCEPLRRAYDRCHDGLPWHEVERLSLCLEAFKRARGLLDYTDMLARAEEGGALPRLDVLICDEQQDCSLLQWKLLMKLSSKSRRWVISGDDDQCHPPGTKILTTTGDVPIEKLTVRHRVIQFSRDYQCLIQKEYKVRVATHTFSGKLVDVNGVRCTPDHKFLTRWARKDGYATYLMRRGQDWRVGWCQMFNAGKCFHVEIRRRMAGADDLWILRWHAEKYEASLYEQEVSVRYNVPTVMFNEVANNHIYLQDRLDKLFEKLRGITRWEKCLRDHDKYVDIPFLSAGGFERKRSTLMVTEAANLIPGVHAVPVMRSTGGKGAHDWTPVSINLVKYRGKVYGIDAPPHRYYTANNVVVHNCIYAWAGADSDRFTDAPGHVHNLTQSNRVPPAVQPLAERVIERVRHRRPKRWLPRTGSPGSVDRASHFARVEITGSDVLVLARNAFVLRDQVEPELRRRGVIYEFRGAPSVGAGAASAVRAWERLRRGEAVTVDEVRAVYEQMTAGRGVERGHKRLRNFDHDPGAPPEEVTIADLRARGGLLASGPWYEALDRLPQGDVAYLRAALSRGEKLGQRPRVRLSTIHGAKGGEADHVVLMREVARRTDREARENEDAERRVWYVAATRAKERLTIVESQTALRCAWV